MKRLILEMAWPNEMPHFLCLPVENASCCVSCLLPSHSLYWFSAPPSSRSALIPGLPGRTCLPSFPFHAVHPPWLQAHIHTRAVRVQTFVTKLNMNFTFYMYNNVIFLTGMFAMNSWDTFLCLLTLVLPSFLRFSSS